MDCDVEMTFCKKYNWGLYIWKILLRILNFVLYFLFLIQNFDVDIFFRIYRMTITYQFVISESKSDGVDIFCLKSDGVEIEGVSSITLYIHMCAHILLL